MAYNITATFSEEQVKIDGTYPLDMFVVNASPSGTEFLYFVNSNQDIYGYRLNASGEVTASQELYHRANIDRDEFGSNTTGELGTFSISVPNVDRQLESYIQNRSNLRGCEVYVLTTFAPFLPVGGTSNHVGENPDYRSHLKEKFYIDSVETNENFVRFTCKSKFDIKGIIVPGRTYGRECQVEQFRNSECDPDGNIAASWTDCDFTLESCRLRKNTSRFGGFPSIPPKAFAVV